MTPSPTAGKASSALAHQPSPPTKPLLQPVAVRGSQPAQVLRHAAPAVLLAAYAASFGRLVADPVPTMALGLAFATGLQVLYCVVCLPVSGAQASAGPPASSRKLRPGEKKKKRAAGSEPAGPNLVVATVLSLTLTLLAVPALHAAIVLLGAPLLTHASHTLLCAAHLAALALLPLFWTRAVDGPGWLAVAGLRAPLDEAFGGLVGAAAGAWLGAVPIPLDWDRDWQRWPVTVLSGMYAGYVLGRVLGGTVLFGKRF